MTLAGNVFLLNVSDVMFGSCASTFFFLPSKLGKLSVAVVLKNKSTSSCKWKNKSYS